MAPEAFFRVCWRTGRPSGIRPKSAPTTEAVVGRPEVAQPASQPPATGRTAAAARCRRASRRDREGAFMGIGGRDYSHRSVQRSSLRELSEYGGEPALDTLPASPKPPGGLSHPRWSRSLAYRRRLEPTRPEQHHLPAKQTPEHRTIAKRPRQTLACIQREVARTQRVKATVSQCLGRSVRASPDRCRLLSVSCKEL